MENWTLLVSAIGMNFARMRRDVNTNLRPYVTRARFSEKRTMSCGRGRSLGFMLGIKKPRVVGGAEPERKAGRREFGELRVSCCF